MFKTYLRLLGFARPIKKYAIPYFFYAVLHAIFNTFNYAMIIPIINTMFLDDFNFAPTHTFSEINFDDPSSGFSSSISYIYTNVFGTDFQIGNMLMLLATVTILTNMLSNIFKYLSSMTVETMRASTLQRMRNDMFSKVMGLNVGYFSDQRKGDIISKITSDVGVVQFSITNTLQVAFREPMLIIGYVTMMLYISWELSLFALFFLPVTAVIIGSIVKKLREPAIQMQQRMGDMVSVLDESLSGIKVIKSYNATDYIKYKFTALNEEVRRLSISMARRQLLASPMSEFLGITAISIVIVFGGALVAKGAIGGAGFLGFIGVFSQITRPIRSFIDQFANINQGIAAGERIFSVIDTVSEVQDKKDAIHLDKLKNNIEFKNLHFSYEEGREILSDISFDIKRGETVALVGPSGGGKSTLSELITRFYDSNKGDILIDGLSIKDYNQESIRKHMSMVAQDTILFHDTIENNIGMGKEGSSLEEIMQAAKVANAHDFITNAPMGYQTNIGDRGLKLSGGQRQRLSIARAVLKNPEILILDEATSALDTESEKLVQDALTSLLKGRTSIVIAHRLSTIYNANKIVVIDAGHVAEIGTHNELLAKGKIYAKLIEMQSFE